MLKLKPNEYITHQSAEWKRHVNAKDGGVYLISTGNMLAHSVCKVGIAKTFNSRFGDFRGCYGWFDDIYVLGLIITKRPSAQVIEKEVHKKFEKLRINYRITGRPSEWIVIDPQEIKRIFDTYRGHPNVNEVILKFEGLSKAPAIPDLDIKNVKKKSGTTYKTQFEDGTSGETSLGVLKKTLDVPPLKEWQPALKSYQKEYDAILKHLAETKTQKEIRDNGGDIGDWALDILKERIEKKQSKEAERRHRTRLMRFDEEIKLKPLPKPSPKPKPKAKKSPSPLSDPAEKMISSLFPEGKSLFRVHRL